MYLGKFIAFNTDIYPQLIVIFDFYNCNYKFKNGNWLSRKYEYHLELHRQEENFSAVYEALANPPQVQS